MKSRDLYKIIFYVVTAFTLTFFQACKKIETSDLDTNQFYIATIESRNYLIKFDTIEKKRLSGFYYIIDTSETIYPSRFQIRIQGRKCNLEIGNVSQKYICKSNKVSNDKISGIIESKSIESEFSIRKYIKPEFIKYDSQFKTEKYKVSVIKDITYANAKGFWTSYPETNESFDKIYCQRIGELLKYNISPKDLDLKLDIYYPENDNADERPLVMLIHGGAFYNGDKESETYKKWCTHFASLGYIAVSINYRMGFLPSAEHVDRAGYRATQDANAAMRYMVHNANKYKINKNWIFVGGTSAGAITALNLTFMKNHNKPKAAEASLTHSDLGAIECVNSQIKDKFEIKAVANMWGAVHDINMIANSNAAIISFHGDADKIVPYGYDYPFKDILNPMKNSLSENNNAGIKIFANQIKKLSIPINEFLFNKMYGSAAIHERSNILNKRNKLYTYPNGGHSLHVDKNGKICKYFYFIQDSVSNFFYDEIVSKPLKIVKEADYYKITNSNIKEIYWNVVGGIIISSNKRQAKILWFADSKTRKVIVSGIYVNGVNFYEEI